MTDAVDGCPFVIQSFMWRQATSDYRSAYVAVNSDGSIAWQRSLRSAAPVSNLDMEVTGVSQQTNGVSFAVFSARWPTQYVYGVVRFSADGTVDWKRYYLLGSGAVALKSVAVDSSGDVYCLAQSQRIVVKLSGATGAVMWAVQLSGISDLIDVTQAGSQVIVVGRATPSSQGLVVWLDGSSGALVWASSFLIAGVNSGGVSVTADDVGGVYVVSSANAVTKWDSGALSWALRSTFFDPGRIKFLMSKLYVRSNVSGGWKIDGLAVINTDGTVDSAALLSGSGGNGMLTAGYVSALIGQTLIGDYYAANGAVLISVPPPLRTSGSVTFAAGRTYAFDTLDWAFSAPSVTVTAPSVVVTPVSINANDAVYVTVDTSAFDTEFHTF